METNEQAKLLHSIYYDTKNNASYSSAKKLYQNARAIDPSITFDAVKEWLSGEITYTLHKPARRRWKRNPIHVNSVDEQWEADLTFLKDFKDFNDGYMYILTVIDVLSKYAWAKPLRSKKPEEVIDALKDIFASSKRKPFYFRTDQGKEFDNTKIKSFFKKNKVEFFMTNSPEIKCAIVERFNRTIKTKMFKIFTATGSRVWHDKLDSILESYNNTVHSATKFKPKDVVFENQHHVYANLYKNKDRVDRRTASLSEGETIRKRYDLKTFDRGYYPYWTDTTYQTKDNIKDPRERYRISDNTQRRYYPEEVQKIKPILYRIEKIIRRRKVGREKQVRVKWLGFPNSYNSWIPESTITQPS